LGSADFIRDPSPAARTMVRQDRALALLLERFWDMSESPAIKFSG
jgi:hypothetical protein